MNINALKTREENALATGQTFLSEHSDTDGTEDDKDKDCHCVQNCKK